MNAWNGVGPFYRVVQDADGYYVQMMDDEHRTIVSRCHRSIGPAQKAADRLNASEPEQYSRGDKK